MINGFIEFFAYVNASTAGLGWLVKFVILCALLKMMSFAFMPFREEFTDALEEVWWKAIPMFVGTASVLLLVEGVLLLAIAKALITRMEF